MYIQSLNEKSIEKGLDLTLYAKRNAIQIMLRQNRPM